MLILWIRKKKTGEPSGQPKGDLESFQKHIESMKNFCLAHPKLEETPKDVFTMDNLVLAPVQHVKLSRNAQN